MTNFEGVPERRHVGDGLGQGNGDRDFFEISQSYERHHDTKEPARAVGEKHEHRRSNENGG